jgi:hypothetical protein
VRVEQGIELDGSSTLPVEFGRQLRNPKAEGRKKAEIRNPKQSLPDPEARCLREPPYERRYYLRQARLLAASVRSTVVLLRAPSAARRLLALRTQLIADIEQSRQASGAAPETELLLFKASPIHGTGAFAKVAIRKGTRVLEYVGERISKAESLRRCEGHNEYIFALNSEQDLDGNVAWNPARFINHSCAPNCEAQMEDGHIWIAARRDIQPGEEITFNYAYDLEDYMDYPCHCGSPGCVGYIVAEEFFDHVRNRKA